MGTTELPQEALRMVWLTLKQQLQLPLTTKQQWLESVDLAICQKQQYEFGPMASKQHLMHRF